MQVATFLQCFQIINYGRRRGRRTRKFKNRIGKRSLLDAPNVSRKRRYPVGMGVGMISTKERWARIMDKFIELHYRDLSEEDQAGIKTYTNLL